MKRILSSLLALAFLVVAGCGTSNHLADYDFRDRTVAVVSNIPPYPEVETGDFIDLDRKNLLATIAHAGSAVVKETQAHKARKRLDEAMHDVDVSQLIADRVLDRSALYLRATPVADERDVALHTLPDKPAPEGSRLRRRSRALIRSRRISTLKGLVT